MATTKTLYIYGAGGHGLVCADIARAVGYENIIFLDDSPALDSDIMALCYHDELERYDMFVAIGSSEFRQKISQKILSAGFNLISLIHPSAIISSSASIGAGVCVMPKAVINAKAKISSGAIINTSAVIEHECTIGEYAHICPAVALAGACEIGAHAWVGIGSCAIQGIKIGANAMIGAGSVIVRDIPDGAKAYGNPARVR